MEPRTPKAGVLELRVALTAAEHKTLVEFYRAGLGLEPAAEWTSEDGGQGLMFEMGRASLEVFDERYAAGVDQVEVGRRVSGAVRLALRVPDLDAALARLATIGATVVHGPVVTPWGDRNARVQSPDGMQITLYQAADGE
jgi:catechol 2,3-dioxygenase-like lactoylglutathione lyase family enzyme